jgi:hypothetical protein
MGLNPQVRTEWAGYCCKSDYCIGGTVSDMAGSYHSLPVAPPPQPSLALLLQRCVSPASAEVREPSQRNFQDRIHAVSIID